MGNTLFEKPVAAEPKPVSEQLLEACRQGELRLVQKLTRGEISVDARDPEGLTPLMLASLCGHWRIATLLLQCGADPCTTDKRGRSALIWAAISGRTATADALLKAGSDLNAEDKEGSSDPNVRDKFGFTALMRAIQNDRMKGRPIPPAASSDGPGQSPPWIAFVPEVGDMGAIHEIAASRLKSGNCLLAAPGSCYYLYFPEETTEELTLAGGVPYTVSGFEIWNLRETRHGNVQPGKFTFTPPVRRYRPEGPNGRHGS